MVRHSTRASAAALFLALGLVGPGPALTQVPTGPPAPSDIDGAAEADPLEELSELETEVVRLRGERSRASAELEGLSEERGRARRRLKERARLLYRLHRRTGLPGAGGLGTRLRHRAHTERLGRMVASDLDELASLSRRAEALRHETGSLAARIEETEARLEQLRREAEEARREMEAAAAWGQVFRTPSTFRAPVLAPGLRVLDEAPGATFARRRGSLPIPVSGSATVRDAQREGGAGLELSAPFGAAVRAVASGRVAYAAEHPTYGRLLVLDHGGGYYTVYGGLGSLRVGAGQTVARDARLADASSSPVFFQVRQGARILNARRWLGL